MRRRSPIAAMAAAGVLVALTGCTPTTGGDVASGCAALIESASLESEPSQQVRGLDQALIACASYDAFLTNLERYSGSIGYDPATYIKRRCEGTDDETIRSGATCAEVVAPETTPPPTTVLAIVFVGNTIDGRPIELRPSAGIEFTGEVPSVIQQTVDIALESGCEGVIGQRDLWAARVDGSPEGDVASVYAQHAQNVANFIECDAEPLTP